jgi:hypothetical protein
MYIGTLEEETKVSFVPSERISGVLAIKIELDESDQAPGPSLETART